MTLRREAIEANLRQVENEIAPFSPTLIVVTKTYPISDVQILFDLGVRNFGENRSSEGFEKSSAVAGEWHYQGEIQSKKIREIIGWAQVIHSLDEEKHFQKLEGALIESALRRNIFLQLSLDQDPARGGLGEEALFELAENVSSSKVVNLMGVMCVPPPSLDPSLAFAAIQKVHHRFTAAFPDATALSAGMSHDYLIALDHGATHIRVGSKILGERRYD